MSRTSDRLNILEERFELKEKFNYLQLEHLKLERRFKALLKYLHIKESDGTYFSKEE